MTGNFHSGSFSALEADRPYPGLTRRAFTSERATVTHYEFEPGARFPRHRHSQEQITLVEEGEIQFMVGDDLHMLAAGDWTVVAGEVEHGITAGAQGARIVAIVVPPREAADAYTVVDAEGGEA